MGWRAGRGLFRIVATDGRSDPRMNIWVITPYYRTPAEWLNTCHRSVRAQTLPATHLLVCDGDEPADIPDFRGGHVILRRNHADYGNTPRLVGCYHAALQGADAIAFLDADNWYDPGHLAGMIAQMRARGLEACASARMLHRLDGSPLLRCPHVDGVALIDTSCLVVMRSAFQHLTAWCLGSDEEMGVSDQVVWRYLRQMKVRTGFVDQATVAYRTRHKIHYEMAGEMPPPETVRRADTRGGRYE